VDLRELSVAMNSDDCSIGFCSRVMILTAAGGGAPCGPCAAGEPPPHAALAAARIPIATDNRRDGLGDMDSCIRTYYDASRRAAGSFRLADGSKSATMRQAALSQNKKGHAENVALERSA
jgi:hypothetical protein